MILGKTSKDSPPLKVEAKREVPTRIVHGKVLSKTLMDSIIGVTQLIRINNYLEERNNKINGGIWTKMKNRKIQILKKILKISGKIRKVDSMIFSEMLIEITIFVYIILNRKTDQF